MGYYYAYILKKITLASGRFRLHDFHIKFSFDLVARACNVDLSARIYNKISYSYHDYWAKDKQQLFI